MPFPRMISFCTEKSGPPALPSVLCFFPRCLVVHKFHPKFDSMSIQINPPDIFTFTDFTPGSSESLTLLNPTAFPMAFRLTWQTEGCTASEPTRYTFEPAQGILKPLGEANSKKEILGSLKLTALLKYDFLSKDYLTVTTIALTEYRDKGVTHVVSFTFLSLSSYHSL